MPHKKKMPYERIPANTWFMTVLLALLAALVPLLVRMVVLPQPAALTAIYGTTEGNDLFSYFRAWMLMLSALAMVAVAGFMFFSEENVSRRAAGAWRVLRTHPAAWCAALFVVPVTLSTLLALFGPFGHTALWGVFDRNEGFFVLLAYMVVFAAAACALRSPKTSGVVMLSLLFSTVLMGAVGVSQMLGNDFFTSITAARWVGVSQEVINYAILNERSPLNPQFTMAYGTSFNPNTYGLITAMLFPVMLGGALAFRHGGLKLAFFGAALLMLAGVVGSRSVGGFIGTAAAVGVILLTVLVRAAVLRGKPDASQGTVWQRTVLAAVLVLVVASIFFWGQAAENVRFTMGRIGAMFEPTPATALELMFDGNTIHTRDGARAYSITFNAPGAFPQVVPEGGLPLSLAHVDAGDRAQYTFTFPGGDELEILRIGENYLYRGIIWAVQDGHIYTVWHQLNIFTRADTPAPAWGFAGWERWGSNRGYIFSRTLPLVPQHILWGAGPDTFIYLFPHGDIAARAMLFGDPYLTVDKAHNMYLQHAVTTGLVSALALLALFVWFIVVNFIALAKGESTGYFFGLRLGVLGAVSAFAVSSLSTDSTVLSTTLFWILLGMGVALHEAEKKARCNHA